MAAILVWHTACNLFKMWRLYVVLALHVVDDKFRCADNPLQSAYQYDTDEYEYRTDHICQSKQTDFRCVVGQSDDTTQDADRKNNVTDDFQNRNHNTDAVRRFEWIPD